MSNSIFRIFYLMLPDLPLRYRAFFCVEYEGSVYLRLLIRCARRNKMRYEEVKMTVAVIIGVTAILLVFLAIGRDRTMESSASARLLAGSSMAFIYRDAKGNITAREVRVIDDLGDEFSAYCLRAKDIRTFKKERVLEALSPGDDVQAKIDHHVSQFPPPAPRRKIQSAIDICFTGFSSAEKRELAAKAEAAGMVVRSSVTQKLDFLCCGDNAGPKKLQAAREKNIPLLTKDEFLWMLKSGELPES